MKKIKAVKTVKNEKDGWKLSKSKDDLGTLFAKRIAKNPKELAAYKRFVAREFKKHKEIHLLLLNLKTIAMAEAIADTAKKTNMKRSNTYRKNNNPSVEKLIEIADDLGITRISRVA
jgi:DNA-binding phage protein